MKRQKPVALLLSVLLVLAFFAGCAKPVETSPTTGTQPVETSQKTQQTTATQPQDSSLTLTDMTGRTITLDEPVSRIVALTAADCEILYAIGAGQALVGRGEYCDYPEEVLAVPSVQSGFETNLEQIIDLAPQVLLMSTMAQSEEQLAALEAAGIQVVVSDAQDIDGVYTAITMIGDLMDKKEAAAALVSDMKDTFEQLAGSADPDQKQTVYFEVSPLAYGLWTAGADTFMNEVADLLGLENAFADVSGWAEVSEEQVLDRDPDYIVTIAMYFGEGPLPDEEILGRPGWDTLMAIQNGAVLNLQNDELSRPGPRLADGARLLFDFIQTFAEDKDAA